MSNYEIQANIMGADKDVDVANQLIKSRSFFTSKEDRYEKAIDLLARSCTAYKMGKLWEKAIDCNRKMYDLHTELKDSHGIVKTLVDMGKLYKNTDPRKAIESYKKAISLYIQSNEVNNAARLWKEIGEMIVSNSLDHTTDIDLKQGIDAYENAYKLFETTDQMVSANDMKLKIAVFNIRLKKYGEAAEMFETVSQHYLSTGKNAWSVREYVFKSIICHMADGNLHIDQIDDKFANYCRRLPAFEGTKEKYCLTKLISSIRDIDVIAFTDTVREHDTTSKFDDLMCEILLVVKQNLEHGITGNNDLAIDPLSGLHRDEIDLC